MRHIAKLIISEAQYNKTLEAQRADTFFSDEERPRPKKTSDKPRKQTIKAKKHPIDSDSEDQPSVKKTKVQKGSKSLSTALEWLFSDDEEEVGPKEPAPITSFISRRVPGGTLRHTGQLAGQLVAEVRLYDAADVRNFTGLARCDKAIVYLRLQGDPADGEYGLLKQFLAKAKNKFTGEGKFFGDKKK